MYSEVDVMQTWEPPLKIKTENKRVLLVPLTAKKFESSSVSGAFGLNDLCCSTKSDIV
jgi:hypothetical protein